MTSPTRPLPLAAKWISIAAALALVFWIATELAQQGYWLAVSVAAFVAMRLEESGDWRAAGIQFTSTD